MSIKFYHKLPRTSRRTFVSGKSKTIIISVTPNVIDTITLFPFIFYSVTLLIRKIQKCYT